MFVVECTTLFDYIFGLRIFFRHTHWLIVLDFSVHHTGVATTRHRRYVLAIRKSGRRLLNNVNRVFGMKREFIKLCCSICIMDGADYWCGSDSYCAARTSAMAQAQ